MGNVVNINSDEGKEVINAAVEDIKNGDVDAVIPSNDSEQEESKYKVAPEEVLFTAKKVIESDHKYLTEAKIIYLFRAGSWYQGDNEIQGKTKLINAENKVLLDKGDFLITINEDLYLKATPAKKEAILDHLLSYCDFRENENSGVRVWKIAKPDLQEFKSVVARHGLYNEALRSFDISYRQMPLFGADDQVIN